MKKRFALSGVLVLGWGILVTGCSSPSQSAAKPPQSVAAVDRTMLYAPAVAPIVSRFD